MTNSRIETIPKEDRKGFAPFCPDFAIEVNSPSDQLPELHSKCLTYVQCGAGAAWLIDPERKTMWVYTSGSDVPAELRDASSVRGSGPLETFVLDLTPIWAGL